VERLNGDGVGINDGDRDGKKGGSDGDDCSIASGVDTAVVVRETED
jgi:hypothetical protein